MKSLTKRILALVMVLSFVVSANSVAFAASTHSTGLKDGLYTVDTGVKDNHKFVLKVVIAGGKVSSGSFELQDPSGTVIIVDYAAYAPDKNAKQYILDTCPEVEYYSKQIIAKGDGALVSKYSKAVSGSTVYSTFNSLWKKVVSKAGGKIVSASVKAKSVTLNKKTASIKVGGSAKLVATVKPSNASNKKVVWTSSNTKVVKVSSSGKITGVASGTATITVKTKDGSHKATCKVTVKAK